ncbi:MAG: response regulator transcription factor [Bacillota bacterium]|nr:response regulator transcription factor [Bacillota bacterium]
MHTILVCDDEKDIIAALTIYLKAEGYQVLEAFNGQQALDVLRDNSVDLAIVDVMMPVMDGITAVARLREQSNIPVILLTAKSENTDKVLGLNVGADDYVTKPFDPVELLARVKAQLRRYTALGGDKHHGSHLYRVGGITLDDEAKSVSLHGEAVALTPTEFDILKLLMSAPDKVFTSTQIYEQVWRQPGYGADNTVAVHIRHLREKLEIDPAEPRYLQVAWGHGYKITGGDRHD